MQGGGIVKPRHLKFCEEYLLCDNATEAYMKVYPKAKHEAARRAASRLLTYDDVSAYIEQHKKSASEKLGLTMEWVLSNLKDVVEKAIQAKPVEKWDPFQKEMVETGEYVFDSKGANRALELIGKQLGMFKDRVEHSGNVFVSIADDIPDGDDFDEE